MSRQRGLVVLESLRSQVDTFTPVLLDSVTSTSITGLVMMVSDVLKSLVYLVTPKMDIEKLTRNIHRLYFVSGVLLTLLIVGVVKHITLLVVSTLILFSIVTSMLSITVNNIVLLGGDKSISSYFKYKSIVSLILLISLFYFYLKTGLVLNSLVIISLGILVLSILLKPIPSKQELTMNDTSANPSVIISDRLVKNFTLMSIIMSFVVSVSVVSFIFKGSENMVVNSILVTVSTLFTTIVSTKLLWLRPRYVRFMVFISLFTLPLLITGNTMLMYVTLLYNLIVSGIVMLKRKSILHSRVESAGSVEPVIWTSTLVGSGVGKYIGTSLVVGSINPTLIIPVLSTIYLVDYKNRKSLRKMGSNLRRRFPYDI